MMYFLTNPVDALLFRQRKDEGLDGSILLVFGRILKLNHKKFLLTQVQG